MTTDWKPGRRIRDPELMRILHADPHKQCAVTGWLDQVEAHHVLPKSQRGDDVRANIVMLDRDFHARITANQEAAMRTLGEYIQQSRPDTIAYLHRKLGEGAPAWMQRRLYIGEKP